MLFRSEIDGVLLDYSTFLRDCLAAQGPFINSDLTSEIERISSQNKTGQISALLIKLSEIRESLTTNASQLLLVESFFLRFAPLNNGH